MREYSPTPPGASADDDLVLSWIETVWLSENEIAPADLLPTALREFPAWIQRSGVVGFLVGRSCAEMDANDYPLWRDQMETLFPALGELLEIMKPWSLVTELPAKPSTRFVLQEMLGRGGMSTVWRTLDRRTGQTVALKILNLPLDEVNAEDKARYAEEARLAGRLEHPGIARVHEFTSYEGQPCLIMDVVEGQTLAEWIEELRRKGLNAPQDVSESRNNHVLTVIRVGARIARALEYAHSHGIVHRDIKPTNIILREAEDGDLDPIILDFGVALDLARRTRMTETGHFVGTPLNAAPEQVALQRGQSRIDARADVYSLGLLLYELLSLQHPFAAFSKSRSWADVVRYVEPPWLRTLAPGLERSLVAVLEKSYEKRVSRRYDSAAEVAEDLERWLNGQRTRARPVTHVGRWLRRIERSPMAIYAGAGSIGAVLTTLLYVLVFTNERRELNRSDLISLNHQEVIVVEAGKIRTHLRDADQFDVWNSTTGTRLREWLAGADLLLKFVSGESAIEGDESLSKEVHQDYQDALESLRSRRRELADVESKWDAVDVVFRAAEASWREVVGFAGLASGEWRERVDKFWGLVPLGPDPASGNEEFLHLPSHQGDLDVRNAAGRITPLARIGVVLVKIPETEGREELWIAKYELTQGQFFRFSGLSPSAFGSGAIRVDDAESHPVENLDPDTVLPHLRRVRLDLPLLREWQHAADVTRHDEWPQKVDDPKWRDLANFLDRSAREVDLTAASTDAFPWRDEDVLHGVVGRLLPSRQGLYDLMGNVAEWCRMDEDPRDGSKTRMLRMGGSFRSGRSDERIGTEDTYSSESRRDDTGFRVVFRSHP